MTFSAGERPRCECGRPAVWQGRCDKHRRLTPLAERVATAKAVRAALRGGR